jgi:O-acetyl-ADP-ribose deacetylase
VIAFSVHHGDITRLDVDAIVNAANEKLLGGGGVDGAIHRAAGPRLLEACLALAEVRPGVRCPTGDARLTPGFELRARHVIHTVGPVWRGGATDEDAQLVSCYREVMALADAQGLTSIACPAVSCGIYGFPADRATTLAVRTIRQALAFARSVRQVVLVGFDEDMCARWRLALAADPAGGWDAVADEVVDGRHTSTIGVDVLQQWARGQPAGASVLDVGCGGGVPVSQTLADLGYSVSGIDASPRMVAAYRQRFPDAPVACESAETGRFFQRTFDAAVSIGLLFLLDEAAQRAVIRRVSGALAPGGRFLFTAPWQAATWIDNDTRRQSRSLGRDAYVAALAAHGLAVLGTYVDAGDNHYYSAVRQARSDQ